jgi:hypothetical protein
MKHHQTFWAFSRLHSNSWYIFYCNWIWFKIFCQSSILQPILCCRKFFGLNWDQIDFILDGKPLSFSMGNSPVIFYFWIKFIQIYPDQWVKKIILIDFLTLTINNYKYFIVLLFQNLPPHLRKPNSCLAAYNPETQIQVSTQIQCPSVAPSDKDCTRILKKAWQRQMNCVRLFQWIIRYY